MTSSIKFNKMEIQNFFSVGNMITVDFSGFNGMNYVYGYNRDLQTKNGSGKSTIFCDALLYALFGKPMKTVNKKHIRNRNFSCVGATFVNVYFTVGSDKFEIHRSLSKSNAPIIVVIKNGEDITPGSSEAINAYIEDDVLNYVVDTDGLV